jgi:phosphopantothenoylcysteine synthetase/decarboxylase
MRCIVTAGPTYEPLDQVRRLTNFSSGRLGSELANFLTGKGYEVILLLGQQATFKGDHLAHNVQTFTTTNDLRDRLRTLSAESPDAVFHAAAVSDFSFAKVWVCSEQGKLKEIKSGKISTREGNLLAELAPTPKIIAELRPLYPQARLIGWKFEVEGNRPSVIRLAQNQINECSTNGCVANGPAYGAGFGLVTMTGCAHLADSQALFEALERLIQLKPAA